MILLFIGPSGSGKDTQAEMLKDKFQFDVVSTGQLLRDISAGETQIQKKIREVMKQGFPGDNIIYGLLEIYLGGNTIDKFILTGVVRWVTQVEKLDRTLENINKKLDKVLYFELSDEEAIKRLGGRSVCKNCNTNFHDIFNPSTKGAICDKCGGELFKREDDQPVSIKARLDAFHKDNDKILEEYKKRGILITIDASKSIEEIQKDVVEKLQLVS